MLRHTNALSVVFLAQPWRVSRCPPHKHTYVQNGAASIDTRIHMVTSTQMDPDCAGHADRGPIIPLVIHVLCVHTICLKSLSQSSVKCLYRLYL